MPRVSFLGVGGGLNHLCEVEVPEMFAEFIGGRLNGVLMWCQRERLPKLEGDTRLPGKYQVLSVFA